MKYSKPLSAILVMFSLLWALSIPQSVVRAGNLTQVPSPQPTDSPTLPITTASTPILSNPDIPSDYILIEGDILIHTSALQSDIAHPDGVTITPQSTKLWPNGVVPYEFDANVTPTNRALMIAAMAEWERETSANVHFRTQSTEHASDYVHIQDNANENSSMVGRQAKGQQVINIHNWNDKVTLEHELGHTLGLYHEQSHPKRDIYIRYNPQNVSQVDCNGSCDSQFSIQLQDVAFYGPYDFSSVMHYGECFFSALPACPNDPNALDGGRTIVVLAPNQAWQSRIGKVTQLSYWDKLNIAFLYPQGNWRFLDGSRSVNGDGKFSSPFNDYRTAISQTPNGGTLWIVDQGMYSAADTYGRPITIQAPLGATLH